MQIVYFSELLHRDRCNCASTCCTIQTPIQQVTGLDPNTGQHLALADIKPKVEPEAATSRWMCVRCNHPITSTDQTLMLDGNLEGCNFCTLCAGPVHAWIRCGQCPIGASCSHLINEYEVHDRLICLNCLEMLGGHGSIRYQRMVFLIRQQVDASECENQETYM